ncbi:MAG: hypothetical protein MUP76_04025, partial [Acidimicrobiia bacterium]|nr:hypothetical protein [Acidimicrobiia bacterium]
RWADTYWGAALLHPSWPPCIVRSSPKNWVDVSRSLLSVVEALDHIYERVIADPGVRDGDLLSWVGEAVMAIEPPVDKRITREARRVGRLARRLGEFWSRPGMAGNPPEDWRSAVDEALGSRGWQPTLDIIRFGLETDPSEELFEEMQFRFAVVHFRPWMEGIDYESYLASREDFESA